MKEYSMPYSHKQISAALDFFELAGVELVNFAVLEARAIGGTMMIGHGRPRSRAEVEKSIRWAAARNANGSNVYIRPARYDERGAQLAHSVIFFDDVVPAMAERICKKYRSLVIQTSRGSCHVWVVTSRPLVEAERFAIQAALAPLVGSDPGSVSGEHFGRAPGFRNRKPGRSDAWISIRHTNTTGSTLDPAPHLAAIEVVPLRPEGGARVVPLRCTEFSGRSRSSGDASASAREFGYAVHRLRDGKPADWVVAKVAQHALRRGKRNTEAAAWEYAVTTVANAARISGAR